MRMRMVFSASMILMLASSETYVAEKAQHVQQKLAASQLPRLVTSRSLFVDLHPPSRDDGQIG
jgi:hypothetical protein